MRIQNAFESIVSGRSGLAARYFQCWCFCWLATRILNIKIMFSTSRYVVIKRKNVKSHCHRRWEIMNDRPFKTKEVHFQARSKLLLGIITYWWLLKITFEQSFWNCLSFLSETETTDWQIILTNSIQVTDFQRVSFGTILSIFFRFGSTRKCRSLYLVQLIEHPLLRIPNFNCPNLRCYKVFFLFNISS